jgi:hypothetical protein
MSQQTEGIATARQLETPAARALADLAAIFDDLQFTLTCCERLLAELTGNQRDAVTLETLWVGALCSYARCFRAGERGMGLTDSDLEATGLKGDVSQWHALLLKLRDHYVDGAANPRETFSVGVSQASTGAAAGIAITSVITAQVDETTVQQTGRLAFELRRLLDERIKERQEKVFAGASEMSAKALSKLPEIEVVPGG